MKNKLNIAILIGFILGIVGGLICPDFMNNISFVGTIYVNLLKFIIIPIIFTSISATIFKSNKSKSAIILKIIVLFTIMFIATFLLTTLLFTFINPLNGVTISDLSVVEWSEEISKLDFSKIIINLFPSNLSTMIQNNSIFASILFSVAFGLASSKVRTGKKVMELIEGFRDIFYEILKYIMYLTPLAVFSLIGSTIANYGFEIIGIGAKYIGTVYLFSLLIMISIMILPVWTYAKINPIVYIKKILKVWLITITTCSSSATLPYTIKTCNEELNISNNITDIVVPLGCTVHMCGGALSFALLGLFSSQLFGIQVTISSYLMMLVGATLINMSAPGIPSGGIILGATYLSMLNIPLSFIGIYSGMYRLLDMAYTTLNVTGDITANVLIYKSEKKTINIKEK